MHWLVPFSSLTPAQQDAVQMDTRTHKAIIGGPGAGKTLVLVHRLNLLFHRAGSNPNAVRLFVYTNTLKQFIRAGNDMLDVPDECISTFDKWCSDTYRKHVDQHLPRRAGGPDFEAIRAGVFHAIDSGKLATPVFDYVLLDEAQDMDVVAIEILKRVARHITVCMDGKQQLYDGRMSEPEALTRLGLVRQNAALLAAFRCNPMVTELAAQFIPDEARRQEFMRQASNHDMDRSRPLFYVADSFADEMAHLVEMVRLRLSYGDSIAVLFPQQRQVHGFARGFKEAGIDVEVQRIEAPIDFANPLPKLMTYHQAKGLTFDSVFLPRLDQSSFPGQMRDRIGHLCFVGAIPAGIIYCLRAEGAAAQKAAPSFANDAGYPLAPHYLVHVGDEGAVLLPYTQAKRILDHLKRLSLGRDLPDAGACARFDKATQQGEDMRQAQRLLAAAIASVVGKTQERAVASLFSPGGTHAMKGEFAGSNDFEVVAFMVILAEMAA